LTPTNKYDVAIAGGGLAGLATAILLNRKGYKIIVFEKETYPFHKVCGEYISNESKQFLKRLGPDVDALGASSIQQVIISSIKGKTITEDLHLGGFALSRYILDHELAKTAMKEGVVLKENNRVNEIRFNDNEFEILADQAYASMIALACFGKKSNLDVKWKREFTLMKKNRLNNFVGIKYHVRTDFPADMIALYNFPNGYGGLVKIEADKYCFCYLTNADNLQRAGGIKEMEEKILAVNPHLKKILTKADILYESPLTISQISFDKKTQVEDHVLMIGDAAGMITSLCGNGMSMALHGAKIASHHIDQFLQGKVSRAEMEKRYQKEWKKNFATRLWFGRTIQSMFDSRMFGILVPIFKAFPFITRWLIRQTHGKPF
jgi:menaquinone-9 beta-reductase